MTETGLALYQRRAGGKQNEQTTSQRVRASLHAATRPNRQDMFQDAMNRIPTCESLQIAGRTPSPDAGCDDPKHQAMNECGEINLLIPMHENKPNVKHNKLLENHVAHDARNQSPLGHCIASTWTPHGATPQESPRPNKLEMVFPGGRP